MKNNNNCWIFGIYDWDEKGGMMEGQLCKKGRDNVDRK